MSPLSKKQALITGGSKRIGQAIVEKLAETGWDILLHYYHSEKEARALKRKIEKKGRQCSLLQSNLAQKEGIKKMQEELKKIKNPISLFVHNASLFAPLSLEKVSYELFQEYLHIHTLSPFFLTQELKGKGLKNAIFIIDWAIQKPYRNFAPYHISKGALFTMVKTLAVELAPAIRVNGIAPGPVLAPENYDPEKLAQKTLLKKMGTPENIVQAVLFLVQNDFITGQCLVLDGGRSLYEA